MMNDECSQPEQMSMRSKSFAKTSGSKGLQIYLPLNTSVTYDETKKLSRALAEYLEGEHVDLVTSNPPRERGHSNQGFRSFLTFTQNQCTRE
jgi:DNA primase